MNMNRKNGSLNGRTLYVPRLSIDGASTFAAAFRSMGYDAQLVPESDTYTNDLARQYTIGEECYPQIITLGSFLKVIEDSNFDPQKTAFLMFTTGGPCRFGQYTELIKKILEENLTAKELKNESPQQVATFLAENLAAFLQIYLAKVPLIP
jgi:hypothetical protein